MSFLGRPQYSYSTPLHQKLFRKPEEKLRGEGRRGGSLQRTRIPSRRGSTAGSSTDSSLIPQKPG